MPDDRRSRPGIGSSRTPAWPYTRFLSLHGISARFCILKRSTPVPVPSLLQQLIEQFVTIGTGCGLAFNRAITLFRFDPIAAARSASRSRSFSSRVSCPRRRVVFDFTRRLGRRNEAGPRQVL